MAESLWVTEPDASYSVSWNSVSTLVAVAPFHSEGASRQSVLEGLILNHSCAPFSKLASPSWFAQLGYTEVLRNKPPSLSEHQDPLRSVNLQLWGSTSGVLMQGCVAGFPGKVDDLPASGVLP